MEAKTINKYWSGNGVSVFSTMGASNHSLRPRYDHDYYATHPSAIDSLLKKYALPKVICEPCCGEGHLSRRLEELGYKVYSSDIVDRGYGKVQDFAEMESLPEDCNCILTNPPYRFATQVICHALELLGEGGVCAMFMKTQSLEGKERYQRIFSVNPPRYVFQYVGRMVCARGGDFSATEKIGSAVAYSWWIFEKGYKGKTTLDWIYETLQR